MKCEEFESIILDLDRVGRVSEMDKSAAQAHVNSCVQCAALQESWRGTRGELASYAQETRLAQAPARVEMRLRQEFRIQRRTTAPRKIAAVTVWALAAAAAIVVMFSWVNWRKDHISIVQQNPAVPGVTGQSNAQGDSSEKVGNGLKRDSVGDDGLLLLAENGLGDFTVLPGAVPSDGDEASILRVRMQRGALSVYGLPVNEERAGEWIQVDLLVGEDGVPQAVRLPN
jgi:hypothetical protein